MTMSNSSNTQSGLDQAREKAKDIRDDVADLGRAAKDTAREQWKNVRDTAGEKTDDLVQVVRERPLAAIGVAALAGVLFGVALRK